MGTIFALKGCKPMGNFSRYANKGPINKRRSVPEATQQVSDDSVDATEKVCTKGTEWPVCPHEDCGEVLKSSGALRRLADHKQCCYCKKHVVVTYTTTKLEKED